MCWCLRTSLPTSSFTAHTGRPMSLEHSSLACEYISGTLKLGKWVYNIYHLRNTHVWQWVCLWNAKIWQMSISLECSSLASEYVLGLGVLTFGKWICLWNARVWQVRLWNAQVWQVNLSLKCSSLASEFVSGMLKFGKYISELFRFGKWAWLGNTQVWHMSEWTTWMFKFGKWLLFCCPWCSKPYVFFMVDAVSTHPHWWGVPHSEHRFPAPSSKLCQI